MTATAPVVVTGLGVHTAVAAGADAFEEALRAGRSGITRCAAAGPQGPHFAADLPDFDLRTALDAVPGLPAGVRAGALRTAGRAPFGVQVAVATALQARFHAGLGMAGAPAPRRTALVVAGHNLTTGYAERLHPKLAGGGAHVPARAALHLLDTDHLGVLSQVLDITGEGCTVGGASASGNVGIITAARLLALGAADACLVVGALAELSALERQALLNLGAMSGGRPGLEPDAVCRPFDEDHSGFVPGQGCGALVLETAESATARGAPVLARIAGYGLALDGNSQADPDEAGETEVMTAALRMAGLAPEAVGYVNAHGTGSALGDRTEAAALRQVFGEGPGRPWINATKALTGHCLYAAGVVEAVATVLQLSGGFVHPNINLRRPIDPGLRFTGRTARPADLSYALSNSFGFGGINTSILLAAAPGRPRTEG
ncbi:beta-ketoacyl synthase N-terminal-like domain-containing protein [Streptomyces sp. NPDC006638]|uniref:beta-ketoacyl synthase N-terminal-like domain-containing protein n=1 Tax=Streptomyces sp. NPDC006638 TaxID=3157183 RepID=UPI00339FC0A5